MNLGKKHHLTSAVQNFSVIPNPYCSNQCYTVFLKVQDMPVPHYFRNSKQLKNYVSRSPGDWRVGGGIPYTEKFVDMVVIKMSGFVIMVWRNW